jgi:micrococcal nuclease
VGRIVRFKKAGKQPYGRRASLGHFTSIEGLKPRRPLQGVRSRWYGFTKASRRRLRRWSRLPFLPVLLLIGGLAGIIYFHSIRPPWAVWPSTIEEVASIHFSICDWPPHFNCVIDGDTFYLGRRSIRVADIDAPETHPPRCAREGTLGAAATNRLRVHLNEGPFELWAIDRDVDMYGRELRRVVRDGRSIGDVLVVEGLARKWTGGREPWC